jgi:excisionase family DNA binding protein
MTVELLTASEAARRLDVPTRRLLRLIYDHKIRYVMVDGVAHIPADAVAEYTSEAS